MSEPGGRASAIVSGIALFCGALVLFTGLDSAAKYAAQSVPALEVTWARFVFHGLVAFLMLRPWRDWRPYRTSRPLLQLSRAIFLFLATAFNFQALRTLQLDQTTAIAFASAFTVAALAGPILGEWVGWHRWVAIALGFLGVLVVIRPGTSAFQPAMLYSVGMVLAYTGYVLTTRLLAGTDSPAGMLLVVGVIPGVLLTPIALPTAVWPPDHAVMAALIATGICGALGHWMLIHAHRLAPASVLAPFYYTQMIWMIAAGYLFFDDRPDTFTLAGAGVIIASGLYVFYREQRRQNV